MREGTMEGAGVRMVMLIGLALLAGTDAVASQTVQKCVAADGHVTLTSGDCAVGQVLANTYEAVPEAVVASSTATGHREATTAPRAGTVARERSRASPRTRASSRGKPKPDRCQAARDRREQTLRRVGLKRTFDLLRKLDDEVWAACR